MSYRSAYIPRWPCSATARHTTGLCRARATLVVTRYNTNARQPGVGAGICLLTSLPYLLERSRFVIRNEILPHSRSVPKTASAHPLLSHSNRGHKYRRCTRTLTSLAKSWKWESATGHARRESGTKIRVQGRSIFEAPSTLPLLSTFVPDNSPILV